MKKFRRRNEKKTYSHEHLPQMVSNAWPFLICLFIFAGFPELRCGVSIYRYPLADYTGSAEVVHGGASGYKGLGYVTSFPPHPLLPYNSLYFNGTVSSFVELRVGTQNTVLGDWSFTMFVFSRAPHRGTIFDLVYDGVSPLSDPLISNKIKLELNDSQIVFTMVGSDGKDHGCAVLGTIFTAEAWIPISVVHEEAKGDVIIQTADNVFYLSSDFQNNRNNVKLPQPAKIKLGGSYDGSPPFEGSIVCFAVYDTKFSVSSFNATLTECDPSNWPITPSPVDLSAITSTTTTTTTTSTTATTTATPKTTTSSTLGAFCPEFFGYFMAVVMNSRPSVAATFTSTKCRSNRECGQLCLVEPTCWSFTFNKLTNLCSLYDKIYDKNTVTDNGTHYYRRRDIC